MIADTCANVKEKNPAAKAKTQQKNASHGTTTSKLEHNSVIKNQTKSHQRKYPRFLFNIMPIMFQNHKNMKKSVIKVQSYFYYIKADKWLIGRLMVLFPWLSIVGSCSGLNETHFVTISVPAHVDNLVRPVIPKSCVCLRRKYVTSIDVYEEEVL